MIVIQKSCAECDIRVESREKSKKQKIIVSEKFQFLEFSSCFRNKASEKSLQRLFIKSSAQCRLILCEKKQLRALQNRKINYQLRRRKKKIKQPTNKNVSLIHYRCLALAPMSLAVSDSNENKMKKKILYTQRKREKKAKQERKGKFR